VVTTEGADVKNRAFVFAMVFACSPLLLSIVGAASFAILKEVLGLGCVGQVDESSLCAPGHLLTLGGFMPAVVLLTVPMAVVFIVISIWRSSRAARADARARRQA
jgi:hypothetical protein